MASWFTGVRGCFFPVHFRPRKLIFPWLRWLPSSEMSVRLPRGSSLRQIETTHATLGLDTSRSTSQQLARERRYVGSLLSSPTLPREGLVRKTLALGSTHVVAYFSLLDVEQGTLPIPSRLADFAGVEIPPELRRLTGPPDFTRSSSAVQTGDHRSQLYSSSQSYSVPRTQSLSSGSTGTCAALTAWSSVF